MTLYHQGDLSEGVSGSLPLSTSPDRDLSHYHPDGNLYQFKIPAKLYDDWLDQGLARPFNDYHMPSGKTIPEIRIYPPASGLLNPYMSPPPIPTG
jgi:hypothetical protein